MMLWEETDYNSIVDKLNQVVEDLIKEHEGGEAFFNALDEHIRSDNFDYIGGMLQYIRITHQDPFQVNIIVSGKFGEAVRKHSLSNYYGFKIIQVNGGLRTGEPINPLDEYAADIRAFSNIFMDDSFYSGKTRDVVKAEVERLGGYLKSTLVVYDGSPKCNLDVDSIYPYYVVVYQQNKMAFLDNQVQKFVGGLHSKRNE